MRKTRENWGRREKPTPERALSLEGERISVPASKFVPNTIEYQIGWDDRRESQPIWLGNHRQKNMGAKLSPMENRLLRHFPPRFRGLIASGIQVAVKPREIA